MTGPGVAEGRGPSRHRSAARLDNRHRRAGPSHSRIGVPGVRDVAPRQRETRRARHRAHQARCDYGRHCLPAWRQQRPDGSTSGGARRSAIARPPVRRPDDRGGPRLRPQLPDRHHDRSRRRPHGARSPAIPLRRRRVDGGARRGVRGRGVSPESPAGREDQVPLRQAGTHKTRRVRRCGHGYDGAHIGQPGGRQVFARRYDETCTWASTSGSWASPPTPEAHPIEG